MNIHKQQDDDQAHSHARHAASLSQELTCHLPYATFSVAFALIVLSLLNFLGSGQLLRDPEQIQSGYFVLFHAFHYLHILFAVTGTLVAFSRFSGRMMGGIVLSIFSPVLFCTLSDIALPAMAADILGAHMEMHVCFFARADFLNMLPFIVIGLITGFAIARHHQPSLAVISLGAHATHIMISSLAATFYIVAHGFDQWYVAMGPLFMLLVFAVVIPCTISDVIVPMYFSCRMCGVHEK